MDATTTDIETIINLARSLSADSQAELEGKFLPNAEQSIFIICLYLRMREIYDASILLCKHQNPSAAFITLRSLAECFILLIGCLRDESFYKEYAKKSLTNKERWLKSVDRNLLASGFNLSRSEAAELLRLNREAIDKIEATSVTQASQIFQRFGYEQIYLVIFQYCSRYVHSDCETLDKYIQQSHGKIELCPYSTKSLDSLISVVGAVRLITEAHAEVCKLAGIDSMLESKTTLVLESCSRLIKELSDSKIQDPG